MRPTSFRPDALRALLLSKKIATLDDLKHALGASVDVTVFRKLKPLDYLSSYSHRGRFYTLREIARFDDHGLWSLAEVWFSRFGTLLATAEAFVIAPRVDTSPMNWLPLYTSKSRMRCINWPSKIASPANSFPAGTYTRLPIRSSNDGNF